MEIMCLGTPEDESNAMDIVHWALDQGVNVIDTVNIYECYDRSIGSPDGVAEEIQGKALRGRCDHVVLATKVGMKIGLNADDPGLSRAHIHLSALIPYLSPIDWPVRHRDVSIVL